MVNPGVRRNPRTVIRRFVSMAIKAERSDV
jgi:hypothetical protein